MSVCINVSTLNCVDNARVNYSRLSNQLECMDPVLNIQSCPLECETVDFTQVYSRSRYPTVYYTNFLRFRTDLVSRFPPGTPNTDPYIQKNIVLLNVYYSTIETMYLNEVPAMTSEILIGKLKIKITLKKFIHQNI